MSCVVLCYIVLCCCVCNCVDMSGFVAYCAVLW